MGRYISLDPVILKETRERLGHTQESLAHAIGIRRETYTRIESAGSTQLVTAEKIAGQLEVDLGHLTGTKRQDTLSSPFACEWRYREATGDKHELLLFNTEWELLEFIESHIADERPALDDDLFPELSKKPVPDYSVAPDGTKAGLKLPRRGEKQGASHGFYQFTFRELQYRERQGFVWSDLTKWAQLTIESRLKGVLSKYWPEYRFNGQRVGAGAEFYVVLIEEPGAEPSQSLNFQGIYMLIQFTSWLASRFPICAHRHDVGSSEIQLRYFDGLSGLDGIVIQHREGDDGSPAPFPDEWKDWALAPIQLLTAPRAIGSETPALPNFEEFSDNIPELKAKGVEMKKRHKKSLKS